MLPWQAMDESLEPLKPRRHVASKMGRRSPNGSLAVCTKLMKGIRELDFLPKSCQGSNPFLSGHVFLQFLSFQSIAR